MHLITLINPFSKSCPSLKNFSVQKEFSKLTPIHKTITLLATSIFTLLTVGLGTITYLRKLVGRFRCVEMEHDQIPRGGKALAAGKLSSSQSSPQAAKKEDAPKIQSALHNEPLFEKEFWETHFQNERLHRYLQMAAINGGEDHRKSAVSVVTNYVKFKKITLSEKEKELLIKSVTAQLQANEHPRHLSDAKEVPHKVSFGHSLPGYCLQDGRKLVTHKTEADGSCGLHALLGVPVSGVYTTDASTRRKTLCDWLERQYNLYQLHERACNILEDYFDHVNKAPVTFREATRQKYLFYREQFDKLGASPEDLIKSREIKAAFIYDPVVFRAYCAELMNVNRYLLQEELIMAAECFGLKLELYQPEWDKHAGKAGGHRRVGSATFNSSAPGDKVLVWYNGYNHYERAEIK